MTTNNYPGLTESETESNRFGLSVARLTLAESDKIEFQQLASILEDQPFNVVIVRFPNVRTDITLSLSEMTSYKAIYADTLLYWETNLIKSSTYFDESDALKVDYVGSEEVPLLVRLVFENYSSHYSVNPLFNSNLILDGYVEWATSLLKSNSAQCLVLRDTTNTIAAFAVTDYSGTIPDIKLAGVIPSHRRRGIYEKLIRACMAEAVLRQYGSLAISTQAHNVTVMSAWARLGWTPKKSVSTIHLVRKDFHRE